MSVYKYQAVGDHSKLDGEYSLENLFSAQVTFSKRSNFNDLFDSQVNFVTPKKEEIRKLYKQLNSKEKRDFKLRFMGDSGNKHVNSLVKQFDSILDGYLFYCVSSRSDSNLMWSHYANSHSGFCIEWNSDELKAEEVRYRETIPSINIIEIIRAGLDYENRGLVRDELWQALRTKLDEWKYERELRVQLGPRMKELIVKKFDKSVLVQAKPHWIEAVIFGCRMPESTQNYIVDNMPVGTVFKAAKVDRKNSCIVIE